MKTALITGITGQDGSNLTNFLLKDKEYKIIGMIRRSSYPNTQRLDHLIDLEETQDSKFKLEYGDVIDFSTMNDYGVLRIAKKYGFDITNYPKVKDLLEWYKKNIPEKERIPLMQFLEDITGWDNIRQWNEDYTGPYLENSNTDYTNNVTLSASSKENLNNKLIASSLLKQDSNTNIVDYQKILQKRA